MDVSHGKYIILVYIHHIKNITIKKCKNLVDFIMITSVVLNISIIFCNKVLVMKNVYIYTITKSVTICFSLSLVAFWFWWKKYCKEYDKHLLVKVNVIIEVFWIFDKQLEAKYYAFKDWSSFISHAYSHQKINASKVKGLWKIRIAICLNYSQCEQKRNMAFRFTALYQIKRTFLAL